VLLTGQEWHGRAVPEREDTAASPTQAATKRPWLTRGVGGIGAAGFLADVGHEVPTSLMASFVTGTLGAPAAALGLIEGISDGLAGAGRFVGGALADDPRRRRSIAVGGYTATAVLSALIGATTSVAQAGVLRGAAWAARGLRVPARNALLADLVPAHAYGRAYGFERAMDNLGAIVGRLLALGLVAWLGVRTAILVSVVPGLLAAVAIVFAIRHARFARATERRPLRFRIRPVLPELRGSVFGLLATVQAAGNLAASAIAGLLYTLASPTVAFGYLAAWMLIALVLLIRPARTSVQSS
jgi:predicted MFS family arabinose efflux permease